MTVKLPDIGEMRYMKGKLKKYFKKRFANVLRILMIFQGGVCTELLQNFAKIIEDAKNLAKNEEKSSSTCLQPISPWYWTYPKPGFRVPEPTPALSTTFIIILTTVII